jgi:glutathione synthase/RimK-type ligase-like ATP-grasp enzyme
VIGGRVVGAMRRTAPVGKLKANKSDAQLHRVALSAELEWLVLETVKIIGLDIAAVNLLIDSDSYR